MFHDPHMSPTAFVKEALSHMGAEWERSSDGIISVLLPGERDLKRITFEAEVAREEKEVELALYGSRFLETLAEVGMRRGRLARAWVQPAILPPPPLSRAYALRAESVARSEWTERLWTTWVFAFGIRFAGEFCRDALTFCAVDGTSLRLVRRFEDTLSRVALVGTGPAPGAGRSFEECYRVAREEIFRKVDSGFHAAQRESDGDLQKEMDRLERYYRGLTEEMNADMERLPAEDPRRTAILARIRATRADRDRSVAQAHERYRLSLEGEAIGALGIVYPRRVTTITLSQKKGIKADLEAAWDPVFEQYEALICPACGKPTYTIELHARTASCGCCR